MTDARCEHIDEIREDVQPNTPEGCEECLKEGSSWINLRMCMTCGHVGCCDSSPNQHATKHYQETKHPIMQSLEPGESQKWCYVDEITIE